MPPACIHQAAKERLNGWYTTTTAKSVFLLMCKDVSHQQRSTHGTLRPTATRCPQRTPFVDSTEMALILGEPHTVVHPVLGNLLAEGVDGRMSLDTAHLPSSEKYFLTAKGIRHETLTN